MEMGALDEVQDTDYQNVLQSAGKIARCLSSVPLKQRRGQRTYNKDDLEVAEQALSDDVQRLLTSPHAQVVSPPPSMSREATMALRALYDVVQVMIDAGDDASKYEKELEAAVKRVVTAVHPEHTIEEEKSGEKDKKGKGESATRKRKRNAGLKEEYSDDDMFGLVNVDGEDEDDDDEQQE